MLFVVRFSLNGNREQGHIQWEREIITPLAGTGKLFALPVCVFLILGSYVNELQVILLTGDKLVVTN